MGDPPSVNLGLLFHFTVSLFALDPQQELGRTLFFDPRLSADGTVSCASCHPPEHGFADPRLVSVGIGGARGKRNAPTVLNKDRQRRFFWDGRAATLEAQARGPLFDQSEMGNSPGQLEARLSTLPDYPSRFTAAFGDATITVDRLTAALAAYQRSLVRRDSAWDLWLAGDKAALNPIAEAGRQLFFGKANCSQCHAGPDLGGLDFANISVGSPHDEGRRAITLRDADWRLFAIPSLRDVARTAPYMHDGSLATLADVIEFYDRGGEVVENKDYRVQKLNLKPAEKRQLLAFLQALTTSAGQAPSTPRAACFPIETLPAAERPAAAALFLSLLDGEALYTVAGIKPMSSGFAPLRQPEFTPNRQLLEQYRRWLQVFRCGDELTATLSHFRATFPNPRTGEPERSYEGVLLHGPLVRQTLQRHSEFFATLGLTASSHPLEVLQTIEYNDRFPRWRGYGYLFGYPDHAVNFFVEAGIQQQLDGRFVERDFIGAPTHSRAERGVVYAVPKGHSRNAADERFLERLAAVFADYRARREKFIGEGKPGVIALLRDWFCGDSNECRIPSAHPPAIR